MEQTHPLVNAILSRHLDEDDPAYLGIGQEMSAMWRELQRAPRTGPPRGEKTRSESSSMSAYSPYSTEPIGAYNPSQISLRTMHEMLQDGMVSFILDIRGMPIIAIFREEPGESWDVECDTNEELEEVCRQAMTRIIHSLALEAQTARAFGFFCAEKVFELISYDQLGVREDIAGAGKGDKLAWVYEKVKGNSPLSISDILRNKRNDRFEGYVQEVEGTGPIKIRAKKAFVFTHRKKFGNLWGEALLSKMYVPWWWGQFVWRAILRYLDRLGTPVCVVYCPSLGDLVDSKGNRRTNMDYAMQMAIDVGKSSAAVIPSDMYPDEEGGGPMWRIEYLQDQQRAGQFIEVRRDLDAWLFRSANIPEKAVGVSPDQTGAYSAWAIPYDLFMLTEEQDLAELVDHINRYLLPPLGLWNGGDEFGFKGKVVLTTKGLDRSQMERARELAEKAMQSGHPDLAALDLRALFEQAGAPTKEEAEMPTPQEQEATSGAQGAEAGEAEATTEEQAEEQGAVRSMTRTGTVESMALTNDEFVLLAAHRQLREQGYVTIEAENMDDAHEKAAYLQRLGFDRSVPIYPDFGLPAKGPGQRPNVAPALGGEEK